MVNIFFSWLSVCPLCYLGLSTMTSSKLAQWFSAIEKNQIIRNISEENDLI